MKRKFKTSWYWAIGNEKESYYVFSKLNINELLRKWGMQDRDNLSQRWGLTVGKPMHQKTFFKVIIKKNLLKLNEQKI